MSSPQQPWSPDQQGTAGSPDPTERGQDQDQDGTGPLGYPPPPQAPQRYAPQGYPAAPQAPQGYAPQDQAPQGYPAPPQAPQGYPAPPQAPEGRAPQAQGQAYGGGPTGELVLTLQKPFGSMGMISPVVTIDGYPATCRWGRNAFSAPAGVRQVDVAQTYLWTYGRASTTVAVAPGSSSEIWYIGPMWTFGMGGRMGTEPQKRPGKGLFIGIMVFVGVVLLLAILAGALSS